MLIYIILHLYKLKRNAFINEILTEEESEILTEEESRDDADIKNTLEDLKEGDII